MTKLVRSVVRRLIERSGYELVPASTHAASEFPTDFEPNEIEIYRSVATCTLAGPERTISLIRAVKYLVENEIPGDLVECGVWKGGSMMAVALTLLRLNRADRRLWLYDTFTGMSEPTAEDISNCGYSAQKDFEAEWLRISKEKVRAAIAKTGYDLGRVEFVEGKVEDTIPTRSPDRIALLRLDTDWYESTRHEFIHLYPRLSRGGVLLVDDYGHWQGARKATDEYIRDHRLRLLLSRIDHSARIAVKQED
jgi:hypothetical protein